MAESSGVVRYELGYVETYSAVTGQRWDGKAYAPHIRTRATPGVLGTVLMQMMAALPDAPPAVPKQPRKVLVLAKAAGFVHSSERRHPGMTNSTSTRRCAKSSR